MLIIWGEHDEVFPLEFGQKLSADFDAELFVIPNTRHAPNIERPKLFEKRFAILQSNHNYIIKNNQYLNKEFLCTI